MKMDPSSLIGEESYPSSNVSSHNLAEIWQLQMNGYAVVAESVVGLEQVSEVSLGKNQANFKAQNGAMKRREPNGDSINRLPSDNSATAIFSFFDQRTNKPMFGSVHPPFEQNDNKKWLTTAGSREMKCELKTGAEQRNSQQPQQDYIHVRARRGQATGSHSLAERARREKINERMTTLQDLVPGCNQVTGKAMVLDEIINYVQSLQNQVEFLSMKLEAVNSRVSPGIEVFPPKDASPNLTR